MRNATTTLTANPNQFDRAFLRILESNSRLRDLSGFRRTCPGSRGRAVEDGEGNIARHLSGTAA
jgi:hypothetical protein